MTILEGCCVTRHRGLKRDQLGYFQLTRDRQVRAYEQVREEDRLMKAQQEAFNETIDTIMHPKFGAGDRVWIYDDKSTIS